MRSGTWKSVMQNLKMPPSESISSPKKSQQPESDSRPRRESEAENGSGQSTVFGVSIAPIPAVQPDSEAKEAQNGQAGTHAAPSVHPAAAREAHRTNRINVW